MSGDLYAETTEPVGHHPTGFYVEGKRKSMYKNSEGTMLIPIAVALIIFAGGLYVSSMITDGIGDQPPLPDMDMLIDCLDEVFEGTELKTLEMAMSSSSNYDIEISTTLGYNDIWYLNIHQDPYVTLTLMYCYDSDDGWYVSDVDWPNRRK